MRHLARILAVAVPIVAASVSTIVATPAVKNFAASHPLAVGYVLIVAGALRAGWKVYTDSKAANATPAPPSTGSTTMKAL